MNLCSMIATEDKSMFWPYLQLISAVVQLVCWIVVLVSLTKTNKHLNNASKSIASMKGPK